MKRILVTGCGGFLGREIVRQLVARGDRVTGFGRGNYPALASLGVRMIQGDVRNAAEVAGACCDVDAVVHTAAVAGVWGPWQHYHSINTVGTENVIAGCLAQGVRVLVHCSSPSVTFDGGHQSGIDESVPYASKHLCHYSHTKALAEIAVLRAHQPDRLQTVALRPHLIWGVEDPHLLPRLIDRAKSGRLAIVGDGKNRIDTVHVVNAAAAHVLALDQLQTANSPAGGRAYFITQDEPVLCWEWIADLLRMAKVARPRRQISFRAAWRIGAALEIVYRVARIRREPPMTRFVAAQLARDHFFNITAAREMLGYRPQISTEAGLQELGDRFAKP